MPAVLLLKLFLVPLLIYAVTLCGRRWGPGVAGWLSAFPIIAGPILLAIALEQGASFAATAAEGTLLAVVAILVFGLAYAWASARFGVAGSLATSLVIYALAVAALQSVSLTPVASFLVVCGALLLAPRLFPVMGSVLTGFSHASSGRAFAVALLRGMVSGYYAFAVFCLVAVKRIQTGLRPALPVAPGKA